EPTVDGMPVPRVPTHVSILSSGDRPAAAQRLAAQGTEARSAPSLPVVRAAARLPRRARRRPSTMWAPRARGLHMAEDISGRLAHHGDAPAGAAASHSASTGLVIAGDIGGASARPQPATPHGPPPPEGHRPGAR